MAYNIQWQEAQLKKLILHKVGNKAENEGTLAARHPFDLEDQDLKEVLQHYFLDSFGIEACYRFDHETDLGLNEVYTYCAAIFADLEQFQEQSVRILQHLYNQSEHSKIRGGELYVAYFENCIFEDELVNAIGIFKAEHKDTFLKIKLNDEDEFVLEYEQGTNTAKLDKGCLIFNTEAAEGYRVLTVDLKSAEAKYWKDEFLRLTQLQDDVFRTKNYLQMCKTFSKNLLKEKEDKQEQVSFLNKSLEYFEENDTFSLEQFTQQVFEEDEEQALKFQTFKKDYEHKQGIQASKIAPEAEEEFFIAPEAVKKAKRSLRTSIQLDTQLEIKLNAPQAEGFLEKAYDEERGMYYYKVYFNQEK